MRSLQLSTSVDPKSIAEVSRQGHATLAIAGKFEIHLDQEETYPTAGYVDFPFLIMKNWMANANELLLRDTYTENLFFDSDLILKILSRGEELELTLVNLGLEEVHFSSVL